MPSMRSRPLDHLLVFTVLSVAITAFSPLSTASAACGEQTKFTYRSATSAGSRGRCMFTTTTKILQ